MLRAILEALEKIPSDTDEAPPCVTPHAHKAAETLPEVEPRLARLLSLLQHQSLSRKQLQHALRINDSKHLRRHHLQPALQRGVVKMTLPHKTKSNYQRYRLTPKGQGWLESMDGGKAT